MPRSKEPRPTAFRRRSRTREALAAWPDQIEAAATRAIAGRRDDGFRLKMVPLGAKLPDLNGTNRRIREILAAWAKAA